MIGGNFVAKLQCIDTSERNDIGEHIQSWTDLATLNGWLDYTGGEAQYTHDAKLQETTHVFICDYAPIDKKPNDKRMIINDEIYEVKLIDDPMGLHQHIEIFLKYVG